MNPLSEKDKTVTEDLLEFPFKVTERLKMVILIMSCALAWAILIQDVSSGDGLLSVRNLKGDPIDIAFAVSMLIIGGVVAPLAVWFTSTTLLVDSDSMQTYKIFGLARRKYRISEIKDIQTFGMSATKTKKKKVRPRVAVNFSDGSNVTFTADATNFDRLLRYLELKPTKIQMAD